MNGNTHKCNLCARSFKTAVALAQHKADSHPAGVGQTVNKPAASSRGRRGRGGFRGGRGIRRGRGGVGRTGFDIAPSRVPPSKGDAIVVTGTDRIDSFDVSTRDATFKNYSLSPGLTSRLENIAKGFQRIQWRKLVAYVTPQASATTNGGYVAGFVMDPEDLSVTADHLASNKGAITKKWYETAVISMPTVNATYFINPGAEPRLVSPGRFWLVGDGKPQNTVHVVVTIEWTVHLTMATVERMPELSITLQGGDLVPLQSNYNLRWQPTGGSGRDDVSPIIPKGLPDGTHFWRVPTFIIEYSEGTGDTGTIGCHFIVYKTSDKKMYYSTDGANIVTTTWQGDVDVQVAVPCGTYCRYAGMGNVCQAPSSIQSSGSKDSEERLKILLELQQRMEKLEMASLPSKSS